MKDKLPFKRSKCKIKNCNYYERFNHLKIENEEHTPKSFLCNFQEEILESLSRKQLSIIECAKNIDN
jgi:hypothetical protein